MGGFTSMSNLVSSLEGGGQLGECNIYKTLIVGQTIGTWYEFFQSAGQPGAGSFTGSAGVAAAMNNSTTGALNINGNVSTKLRYLMDWSAVPPVATQLYCLCDFLLYYPSININASPTTLNNTVTLPRYTNGVGVQAIVTTTTLLATAAPSLTMTYTDSASNSTTGILSANATTAPVSSLWSSQAGGLGSPFLPMGSSGQGVKSITSYTIGTGTATGAATIMLVKPLCYLLTVAAGTAVEKDTVFQSPSLPPIIDNACLGIIAFAGAAPATSSVLQSRFRYGWN